MQAGFEDPDCIQSVFLSHSIRSAAWRERSERARVDVQSTATPGTAQEITLAAGSRWNRVVRFQLRWVSNEVLGRFRRLHKPRHTRLVWQRPVPNWMGIHLLARSLMLNTVVRVSILPERIPTLHRFL